MLTQTGIPEPQVALDKIKILENNDPLVDLRTIPSLTFRVEHEHAAIPFLRAPVAVMLAEAVKNIPAPYNLHVISALRSFEKQKVMWHYHYNRYRSGHPEWPETTVRRMVNKYVAPVDHRAPPGHTTGAAIDVVLQAPDGSFVDLVPPDMTDWSLGHTWTEKIDPKTRALRMQLVSAMLAAGFSNCRDEYWHYSWGDSGWAVRTGKKECCYGAVEVPNGW